MTLLWSTSSSVVGPLYVFARAIALWKRPRISSPLYPRAIRCLKKTFVCCILSVSNKQRVKILNRVLYTIPRSSPGGWVECGGMYRCKLSRFSNRVVSILLDILIVTVMSMKLTVLEGSLNSHVRPGNAFIVFLNAFHSSASSFGFLLGHQIPMMSSINLW